MSESVDLDDLVSISRFAGERFDLIQAGGGNTSVKVENRLFVKSSGLALSDVHKDSGFCCVDWRKLGDFVRQCDEKVNARQLEKEANDRVQECRLTTTGKPSIETLMHCLMNRLTLHTHPIAVASVACRSNYQSVLSELFDECICVDYHTPGAALAVAIERKLAASHFTIGKPAIVFLQNHGLIVSAQTADEVIAITDNVNDRVANYLSMDLTRYKLAPRIAKLVNSVANTNLCGYLSEDELLNHLANDSLETLLSSPATPDQLVYCGAAGFVSLGQDESANISRLKVFIEQYGQPPKLFVWAHGGQRHVVLIGANLRKCRDAEDVLKAHCMTLAGTKEEARLLPEAEIAFLANWDAEKYRQKL